MKHTIEHNGKQKVVNIPDEYLTHARSVLKLSLREAVDMWLCDNDYMVNEEQQKLTNKAQAAGVNLRAVAEKKPRKAPVRKPDDIKRSLIAALHEFIGGQDGITNAEVTNIERVIAFSIGEDQYELTLSKKRKPKA